MWEISSVSIHAGLPHILMAKVCQHNSDLSLKVQYIHTKPSIHNTILKYDTHHTMYIAIVVTYHHNVQIVSIYQHFMSNTKNTWVQNTCVAFEWLLVLHSESGKKVQLFVRGVALMPSVGCSYHAKMSVVTHWKKRKVHWTKIYHIMLVPSAPRKYQNICNG